MISELKRRLLATGTLLSVLAAIMSVSLSSASTESGLAGQVKMGSSRVLLPDGNLLIAGGEGGHPSAALAIVDPRTGAIMALSQSLHVPRAGHSVTMLPDGRVLIFGGIGADGSIVATPEIFDFETQRVEAIHPLPIVPRAGHSTTVLTDGRLLVVGGQNADRQVESTVELWHYQSLEAQKIAAETNAIRHGHRAQLLGNGSVLVSGGVDANGDPASGDVVIDPAGEALKSTAGHAPSFLSGSNPAAEARDVPVDAVIALRFSQPLDVTTLNANTITIFGPTGAAPTRVVPAENGTLAFIRPAVQLFPGAYYSVFVNGVVDPAKRSGSFTAFGFWTASVGGNGGASGSASSSAVPGSGNVLTNIPSSSTSGISPQPTIIGDALPDGPSKTKTKSKKRKPDSKNPATIPPIVVGPVPTTNATPAASQNTADDEDWTPDARHRGGKWRTARRVQDYLEQRLRALRSNYNGGTALVGQVLRMNGKPLANVTLRIGRAVATSDNDGRFLLRGLSSGRHELIIDGRTVGGRGRSGSYGMYIGSVDLKPDQLNVLEYTIWMPKIRPKDIVSLPSPTTQEIVVTHPDMPGLELRIPAGTVIRDRDGKIVTEIAITPVPVDQSPFPVAQNFPIYFMIHPGGAVVQNVNQAGRGIRLIYPNYGNEAPGKQVEFWSYDPAGRGWFVYGHGEISADGQQVVPDDGVEFYEHMAAGHSTSGGDPAPSPEPPPCEEGVDCRCNTASDGDPVDCFSGLFVHARTDVTLKDVFPVAIRRVYRPGDTVSRAFGFGASHPYAMYLLPVVSGGSVMDLVLANGARIRYQRISGGLHDGVWEHTASASRFYKSVLTARATAGEFWEIKLRDGSVYEFENSTKRALRAMRDRYGNAIQMTHVAGNITRMTTPHGRYVDLFYDTSSRITEIRDNLGRSARYTYDAAGMLGQVTYPDGTFESYTYDGQGRMLTVRDRRGYTMVTNQYDSSGRVRQQTLADGAQYLFAYTADATGRVVETTVTDPRGNVRRIGFLHPSGYPTSETRAAGTALAQTTTYERDPASGQVTRVIDPMGRRTRYDYDALGNITSVTYLEGTSAAITEAATWTSDFQQIASYTDPLNRTTRIEYDALGNPVRVYDPLNQLTRLSYSFQGQLNQIIDPANRSITLMYSQGDLRTVQDPLNATTLYQTDPAGRVTAVTNAAGELTRYEYDTNDNITQLTDPAGGTTRLGVDALGNVLSVTNPRNSTLVTVTYDSRQRPIQATYPNGTETYAYDGRGNLISYRNRNASTTTYHYDVLDRLSRISYFDGTATTFTYDAGNRLRTLTGPSGTIQRQYDNLDRLTSETTAAGTVIYTYDNASRRTTMTAPGVASIGYQYDALDRLRTITQGVSTASYNYDPASRLTQFTLPNGVTAAYQYNAATLTGITYTKGATALGDLTYAHDSVYRITRIGGTLAQTGLPPAATASYGPDDRLLTHNNESFTYDGNGNLITRVNTCGTTTYTWDIKNQLTAITGYQPDCTPLTASFTYDALGRRTGKTVNGTTTNYLYDGLTPVRETVSGGATANLLTGLGIDDYLARTDGTTTRYFLTNHQGSTLATTDPAGNLQTRYVYAPFGATTPTGEASTNPFQYTGRENDGTGLYYYRARYYDPALGRFISSDPIRLGGGLNMYAYVLNNPLRWVDPLGLARIGSRPLDVPWLPGNGSGRLRHDQIWYDDNMSPDNSGFFDDDSIRDDRGRTRDEYDFSRDPRIYDDALMREAERNIRRNWDMDWTLRNNCQDYVDAARREYDRLHLQRQQFGTGR